MQTISLNNTGCNTNDYLSCTGNIERWEVKKFGSDVYEIIPNSNVNTLNKSYDQIYSNSSGINKTTDFRAKFLGVQVYTYHPFTFIPCSPNVVIPIEKENTSCAYNNDGIVSLTFDRPLIENERFEFSFFKNNVPIITPFYSVDTATNKKYTFSGLAEGNYYVIYQTFIGSQPTSINKKPYPSFTINPATPLTFKLQNPKNPSCFGAEDGSVEVLITSGIPKFFEVDGNSVIPDEIAPNLYRINKLKAKLDGHKIKVKDANNCIDIN